MAKEKIILSTFQFRRDTTENWLANKDIVPAAGEPCYDINLKTLRIGDGETPYEKLPIIGNSEGGDTSALLAEINSMKALIDVIQADIDDMEEQVGEINVVEVHENVTRLTTEVESAKTEITTVQQSLKSKADSQAVLDLQTEVEKKANVQDVEKLETDLKDYVDEQVQNIEGINNDYGEI